MSSPSLRRTAVVACALAPIVAVPALAAPRVRTVATQTGVVRQVLVGPRDIVWTRCLSATGPTQVWTAPRSRGRARQVPGLRGDGPCDGVRLVGSFGTAVVVLTRDARGAQRLESVDTRSGARVLLETESPPGDVAIRGADMAGPLVAWQRESGPAGQRVSESTIVDVRMGPAGAYGGGERRRVYRRSLLGGAVTPTGIWIAPDGSVVVREAIRGAIYGYGSGSDRASLVRDGGLRPYARLTSGATIPAGDLTNRFFAYSVTTAAGRVWMYVTDRATGKRRTIRQMRRPLALPAESPALPAPAMDGMRLAWRDRQAKGRGYLDRVMVTTLAGPRRTQVVAAYRDSRGQRLFVSPPGIRGRQVAWAQTWLANAAGARGGFFGTAATGARTQVLTTVVR